MAHPQTTFRGTDFHGKSMLSVRRSTIAKKTLHTQLNQLRSTGRYDCFKLKWHPIYDPSNVSRDMWPVTPHLFWDSDIGKWVEAACYFLQSEHYDEEIDKAVQELVDMIRSAQGEDGYLNLHYTVVEPEKRWSNLRDMHELYNAGHLIEAALAHRDYYKNDLLLDVMVKYVSLIRKVFGLGEDQLHGYPGHPEIELALFRLYSATGSQDAYDLARYFLEERGNPKGQNGKHYWEWEAEERGDIPQKRPNWYPEVGSLWYNQAHQPILEQQSVEGHSVRCMYLLVAVADMIRLEGDTLKAEAWMTAVTLQWNNMVDKKMYLTGGIGAIKQWEGFGIDYFLPQGTDEGGCYAETCASIGVMMLAERLLQIDLQNPDRRYADVMELCLYNNVMTAMSLDGNAFTYVNQLASSDKNPSGRSEWFEVSCCPPNLARLFGSLGGYLWDYGSNNNGETFINVHLYTTAKLTFDNSVDGKPVKLEQRSNWPWEADVAFTLSAATKTTIRLRLPAWSENQYTLTPAADDTSVSNNGYLTLSSAYLAANPFFSLRIGGFAPRYIAPHPYTNQHTLTLARGPIVYCAEDVDNPWETNHFRDVAVAASSPVAEEARVDEQSGEEYVALKTKCWPRSLVGDYWNGRRTEGAEPGTTRTRTRDDQKELLGDDAKELVLVPYYFRANRPGKGQMRVGLLKA
ncbi:hypothetical protein B0H66DRAFT_593260 [Apodospora peruviana]|uniref:Non-reducing end beta-L-arabinofuranosidase n=1 Tax=Apodospora peruviana TaxID=516989 RepID=A0AAE0HZ33_9PEZI|nr:hypothetical protein B0H66DRAFT_593260 [Apodospora peruviana]